jgi:exosome complex protein LRP1
MDPQNNLDILVDDLDVNIDELTTALTPLLASPVSKTASTLPLLDKAKLYVLFAATIESLLFSALQASGADAKSHAIFAELVRLKGYNAKLKLAEEAGENGVNLKKGPAARLDKEAAARFIRHGLAGNERYDLERAERIAKEKARAALKARGLKIKFDQKAEEEKQAEMMKKRKAEVGDEEEEEEEDSSSSEEEEQEEQEVIQPEQEANPDDEEEDHVESENDDFYGPTTTPTTQPPQKKPRLLPSDATALDSPSPTPTKRTKKSKDKKRSKSKKEKELILPERAQQPPKSHSETFSALLSGSFAEQKKGREGEKEKVVAGKKGRRK